VRQDTVHRMSYVRSVGDLDDRYRSFTEQHVEFLDAVRCEFPDDAARRLDDVLAVPPRPLEPVPLRDPAALSDAERSALAAQFLGPDGVAAFALENPPERIRGRHFVLALAEQMSGELPLAHPVDHPMEQHDEARARFGAPDGTLKLYDLPIPEGIDKYREQAETSELFAAHNDGLGYGGAVVASIIALDSPPAWGGFTCFQHLVRISLALANDDPEAFEALFLPDAIVAVRPRGKGAIRVTSPVLYINARGEPQTFFRVASGEYRIEWRSDVEALRRARALLVRLAQPFAPSSTFAHLMGRGEGVILRNTQIVHSRTPFVDGVYGTSRVLARKWFVPTPNDAHYKHVPGMNVYPSYARLFPEYFAPELLEGEWHFDPAAGGNVRVTDSPPSS